MTVEFQTKAIQSNNELWVALPAELCSALGIMDGTALILSQTPKGTIEITTPKAAGSKPGSTCQICGSAAAKYKCINCGKAACPNCFWELTSLCYACAHK